MIRRPQNKLTRDTRLPEPKTTMAFAFEKANDRKKGPAPPAPKSKKRDNDMKRLLPLKETAPPAYREWSNDTLARELIKSVEILKNNRDDSGAFKDVGDYAADLYRRVEGVNDMHESTPFVQTVVQTLKDAKAFEFCDPDRIVWALRDVQMPLATVVPLLRP